MDPFSQKPHRPALGVIACLVTWSLAAGGLCAADALERELFPGVSTDRPVPGKPYDLAGKRIVFTNWHYVHPGDLDWRNSTGESVYVKGKDGPTEADHVGIEAPRGIRLVAHKPQVVGPLDLPHRSMLRDADVYKAWSNNAYFESADGVRWTKKADCTFQGKIADGVWQVFRDPSAPPEERYKMVWAADDLTKEEFEAFRRRRPDGWEPRALVHYGESGKVSCIRGAVSPDGVHWKALPDPLVVEYSDSYNTCYYDTTLRKYVLYTRYWSIGPTSEKAKPDIRNSWTDVGRRSIGRSESADFRSFPPSQLVLEASPDMPPSETLYTST